MALFVNKKEKEFDVVNEGSERVLRLDYTKKAIIPSIEDSEECMQDVISKLVEVAGVSRIVLVQQRNYNYSYSQVQLLVEIARLYNHVIKQKKFLVLPANEQYKYLASKIGIVRSLIRSLIRDPIGAYVELKRIIREEKIILNKLIDEPDIKSCEILIEILNEFFEMLDKIRIIEIVKKRLDGYEVGSREIYRQLFRAEITPNFMFTRLMSRVPVDGDEIDSYKVGNADVNIFSIPQDIKYLYHLMPPEFKLTEDKQELLDMARNVLIEHKPRAEEFIDPERMRMTFFNIGRDLMQELADRQNIKLSLKELEELTSILVRYTVGFGLLEVLLRDERIQDITINGPIGVTPIFIVHQKYDECVTNIIPSAEDAESWATKFRILSGRPLDEANPILDTELSVPGARARVAIVGRPLNPKGLAYAFRRHRDEPWTLPLFIENRMINPLGAGLMSFIVDGARTILVAGTRSSGKCVKGDTLIQLSDGNIVPINEMIKGKEEKVDGNIIYRDENPPKIVSLENYKLKNKKLTTYWKRKIKGEKLIKIRTKSGREVVTTQEHPYFTFDRGVRSIFAANLKEGQFIAAPRKINIIGKNARKQKIDFKTADPFFEYDNYYLIEGITNSSPVKFPKYMDEKLAEFLGYLLGDGHIDKHKIEFTNSNEYLRERFKKLISNFDIPYREFKTRNTWNIQITSRLLSRALSNTFDIYLGKKSSKIKIPKEILMSERKVLASFLRAYWDCDGYIPKEKRDLEICTKSGMMSKQLQMVFLRFGIVCFCKKKIIGGEIYYRILIRGEFVNKYAQFIGFNHPWKSKRLKAVFEEEWLENTNVDIIPDGDYFLKELRRKLRITPRQHLFSTGKDYWAYENKEYRVSRKWFKILINSYFERYKQLEKFSSKIRELNKFVSFYEDYDDSMGLFDDLRALLNISYSQLSSYTNFTDSWLRGLLKKKRIGSLEDLNRMRDAYGFIKNKFVGLRKFSDEDFDAHDLKDLVAYTNLTYSEVSKNTGISETMLKYYSSGNVMVPFSKQELIIDYLKKFKIDLIERLERSEKLLNRLRDKFLENLVSYVGIGMILGELRNELNIQNEEFASNNLSIGTVSNFFNFRYKNSSLTTLFEIARKVIDIYNEGISDETKKLLDESLKLANSDIFWDEVVDIEKVDSDDEFVYDLTVPCTHNFIANGVIAHNTSFLGSLLVEVMRKYRLITVEDTMELSVDALRELGYNIQPLKVRSALAGGATEVSAEEGIRTALRMGDSALIVGEIRSLESKALYEAMRIGALANVVAGTIHGDSPYGVYDRVVNDLGVPKTSFKATDIIVICNPVKSADGLSKWRRIVQITEVRKKWEEDPLAENGFIDLMKYDAKTDSLQATDDLINGNSEVIKNIASNIPEWAGHWDAVWDNIILRAKMKEALVNYSKYNKNILEAKFVIAANDHYHRVSEGVKKEIGYLDPKRIYFEWEEWLKRAAKKI